MKKGKYVDMNIIMACLAEKKSRAKLQPVDELPNNICKESTNEYSGCPGLQQEAQCTAQQFALTFKNIP